ncbi:MAG: flagellar filament capping protein FliD, partial [Firmicutes bacterium]|nr:flagellar filament capping protein FliD [Bacillota bacterium]
TIQAPQHARVKVNGIEIERPSNEVEVVEGVTFTLRGEGTAVITVVKDVSGAVAKIKDVVDQLNSAMDFMSSRLAKDGILQGDATLVRLQSSLRLAFMDRADTGGKLTTLSEIGITFTREGRAELDESKLREALEEDAHGVYLLLAGSGEGDEGLGIARRARDLIRGYTQTGGVIQGRREMFEAQIASAKESIERMEERLERQEERLYRQFTAMEQALASLQTQSMWLQTQLIQLSMFGATR